MNMKKHIVKRHGHEERFDERKVYASCYAACLSAHIHHREAERISGKVAATIARWIGGKAKVSSTKIHNEIARVLRKHDKNAAFMYDTHKDFY